MTSFVLAHGIPFVAVTLSMGNRQLRLENVLIDTGSGASVFRTDDLEALDVTLQPNDRFRFMSGIGGQEAVIEKQISKIEVGSLSASPFTIQIGALDYGFSINGILGSDFLNQVGATINFRQMTIS